MSPDEYLERVRVVARQAADFLPTARLEEVFRLIEHGEPAEGLCSLAWAVVSEKVLVPESMIKEIHEFTAELIDDEFMPANLDSFALPPPSKRE